MASLFDLHVHTNQGSADSGLTPDEMVADARRLGLTGIMVTEHDGWPRHDFEAFAATVDDIVLVNALEVYTPLGHVITIGLNGHVAGYGDGVEVIRKLRREVDKVGGFMILAHPFRFLFDLPNYTQNMLFQDAARIPKTAEEAAKHPVFEIVDEIEVVNGGNIEEENRFAQEVAAVMDFWGTGGSDAHSLDGFARGGDRLQGRRPQPGGPAGGAASGRLRAGGGLSRRQSGELWPLVMAEAGDGEPGRTPSGGGLNSAGPLLAFHQFQPFGVFAGPNALHLSETGLLTLCQI